MKKGKRVIIVSKMIEIKGSLERHEIVRKIINTFINTEHMEKGRGVQFKYPVEDLPDGQLFIVTPGRKWNFDFKVEVTPQLGLGKGSHAEIASDLRNKKQENQQRFRDLLQAITEIYDCSENDVARVLENYANLQTSFQTGAKIEVLLKVLKWMFIMEDIIYFHYEGRAKLYNYLKEV